MQVELGGKTTDFLGARNQPREESEEGVPSAKQPASDPDQQPPGEELQAASHVCLVQTVRASSRFSKLVKVEVDGPREGPLPLFKHDQSFWMTLVRWWRTPLSAKGREVPWW